MQTHQSNYRHLQELRTASASLDAQIKDTLRLLANTRKELVSTPATVFPEDRPYYHIKYDELLRYARMRYAAMVRTDQAVAAGREEREPLAQAGTRRLGPWGATEVGDDRRRWLYEDDPEGLRRMRERERKTEEKFKDARADDGLARVHRYEMGVSKRIW